MSSTCVLQPLYDTHHVSCQLLHWNQFTTLGDRQTHNDVNNMANVAMHQCLIQQSQSQANAVLWCHHDTHLPQQQQHYSQIYIHVYIYCFAIRNDDHHSPVVIAMCRKLGEKCTQHGGNRFRSRTQRVSVIQKNSQFTDHTQTFTEFVSGQKQLPTVVSETSASRLRAALLKLKKTTIK